MGRFYRIRRILVWTAIIAGAALLSGIVLYQLVVLDPQANRYMSELRTAANQLRTKCVNLTDKTQEILVDTLPQNADAAKKIGQTMQSLSEQTRQELERFTDVAKRLQDSPYIPVSTSAYRKGIVLKNQTVGTIDQIREVLDEYNELAGFITGYYDIQYRLRDELAAFNSYDDLNLIIGQSAMHRRIANGIETQANRLSKLKAPRGLKELTSTATTLHQRATNGFRMLADGLAAVDDNQIYAAAAQLEAVTTALDKQFSSLQGTLSDLPTLRHIRELPEKIDRFKF